MCRSSIKDRRASWCSISSNGYQVSLYLTPMNVGDVTLVEAAGRITLGESVSLLRDQIHELVDRGRTKILLKLADVTYIDSSGIGELVTAYTTVRRHGGALKLLKLTQ